MCNASFPKIKSDGYSTFRIIQDPQRKVLHSEFVILFDFGSRKPGSLKYQKIDQNNHHDAEKMMC